MGRGYYCEYCDRSFRDTVKDRRKHRQTDRHQIAKLEYDICLLRTIYTKLCQINNNIKSGDTWSWLRTTFENPDEYKIFMEVITKPIACKFNIYNNNNREHEQRCKYGDRCKNSHMLNQSQIIQYKDKFLNHLYNCFQISRKSLSNLPFLNTFCWPISVDQFRPFSISSKRQLKKDICLNIWLEERFGMEKRSEELIRQLRQQ